MITNVTVRNVVTTSTATASGPRTWHRADLRCRLGAQAYRVSGWFSRLGDRIDSPGRHF